MRWLVPLIAAVCLLGCGGGARPTAGDAAAGRDGRALDGPSDPRDAPPLLIDATVHEASPANTAVDGGEACVQATEVRRRCTVDAECTAALHVTSCCGSAVWLGIRASALTSFATLEAVCERSYSECACLPAPPSTDDSSVVHDGDQRAVSASCQGGMCKTFATACGRPCPSGRSCTSCEAHGTTAAICALRCARDADCAAAPGARCEQIGTQKLCVDAAAVCAPL